MFVRVGRRCVAPVPPLSCALGLCFSDTLQQGLPARFSFGRLVASLRRGVTDHGRSAMKVKNINGTSENTCKCGSWLDHWKKFSGTTAQYCAERSCTQKPEVGAHVQKDSASDSSWYIVPMCKGHNAKAQSIELTDSTTLVSANVKETCGK